MDNKRKQIIIDALYDKIMEDGTRTTRANELYEQTDERLENKIYVVKLPVNFTAVKGTTVKMLSVYSDKEDFTDSDAHNVRIGFENPNKIWSNLFATECEEYVLENIAENLKIKLK